jgi:hypothetical protein
VFGTARAIGFVFGAEDPWKPRAQARGSISAIPQLAVLDGALSGIELREARGASRGNAFLSSHTRFPSACASGFEEGGVFLAIDANAHHENLRWGLPEGLWVAQGACESRLIPIRRFSLFCTGHPLPRMASVTVVRADCG